jgi:hypothetical protein
MVHRLAVLGCIAGGLSGCIEDPFALPPASCEDRRGFYADTDDDGIGDPGGEVWVTCEDPGEGWTDVPPPGQDTDDTDTDGGS